MNPGRFVPIVYAASITGPLLYTLNWGFLALARIFHTSPLVLPPARPCGLSFS